MEAVVFIIGGNLGDRSGLVNQATEMLKKHLGEPKLQSSVYETQSWGNVDKNDYLNQIVVFETALNPSELLAIGQLVESKLGRNREEKWGDRTMDVDILYYGNQIIRSSTLDVPHPLISERRFVLEPLTEILPDFTHPVINMSNRRLLELCDDNSAVWKMTKEEPNNGGN
jgi:2-amino-4-hydroxy-6-hydroxymethyldihydropteridine diphosphokinase